MSTTTDNCVNVQALLEAREVLKGAPEAAQFTWRARSQWKNGVASTTKVQKFFGLGAEQNHKAEHAFDADQHLHVEPVAQKWHHMANKAAARGGLNTVRDKGSFAAYSDQKPGIHRSAERLADGHSADPELACQIILDEKLESLSVRIPAGAKNWLYG